MKMKVTAFLSFLVLLVAYQNCSPVQFQAQQIFGQSFRADNNGTGYGGKPEGEFYRFQPEFTCEDKSSPVSMLQVTKTEIRFVENQKLQCGAIQQSIDPNQVDSSIYQRDVIGYREGIFESQFSTPSSIPANLVEVWCRTAKDATGIETITHFNRTTSQADTEIYYTRDSSTVKQTLVVSRVISNSNVTVADGKDFLLKVYRDQPAAELGLFKGSLEAMIDGEKVSRETSCRLGGMLDSRIWPATQIVDGNVQLFKISPDLSFFGFTAANGSDPTRLFSSDAVGTNQRAVSPAMLQTGVPNFEIAPSLNSFVFWGDPRLAGGVELFSVNRNGSGLFQLNQPITEVDQAKETEIRFSADGTHVFYRDGAQETGGDIEMWLRSVPLSGGTPLVVNPALELVGDVGVYKFGISKRHNKIAYLVGQSSPELYISNLDGTETVKPPIGMAFDWWAEVDVPDPGEYVFLPSTRRGAPGVLDFVLVSVSVRSGLRRDLPANWSLRALHPDGHIALISGSSSAITKNAKSYAPMKLLDLRTGALTALPAMDQPYFSRESGALVGSKVLPDGTLQPVIILSGQTAEEPICSDVVGTEVAIKDLGSEGHLVAAYDAPKKNLKFVLRGSDGKCLLKNSMPIENPSLQGLLVSPDQKKVLLKTTLLREGKTHDQLFYVPLTGEAPLAVNTAVFLGAKVSSFEFLKDSRTVIYFGDQMLPARNGVYLWRAP